MPMRRSRAAIPTRRSESKRIRSFSVMRPSPGCSSPAMQRNSMDLPAPDAPRMLSGDSPARNATSSVNSASFFSIFTSRVTSVLPPTFAPQTLRVRPVVKSAQQNDGDSHVHGAPCHGPLDFVCFHRKINRDGNCFGFSGNISGEHQGGAEFSQRARKGKNRARQHTRPRQRQRHFAKNSRFGCAQCSRRLQQVRVHLFQRRARRDVHQRKSHHDRGDHRGRPRKHHSRAKLQQQQFSQRSITAKKQQQQKSHHCRRRSQRKNKNSIKRSSSRNDSWNLYNSGGRIKIPS